MCVRRARAQYMRCSCFAFSALGGVHSGDPGWEARVLPPCVATPAGVFYAGVRGPLPASRFPGTSVCKTSLGFFCNAWRPRLAFLYAGVQGPLRVVRFLVTRCIFQCSERQSGTGTSARLHTYVYTCLPTSGRSAEPRLVFGPQHPITLLHFLPSATFSFDGTAV